MDELLDVVDEHDAVIGQAYRSEVYEKNITNFRVVNAFAINAQHHLWIPTRTKHKKLFPSCLDASVGGHVMVGETYLQAFILQTHEELNLKIDTYRYQLIGSLQPAKDKVSAFMNVYAIYINSINTYNPDDFESAQWMSIDTIKKALQDKVPTKGDFAKLINLVEGFLLKNHSITKLK